MGNVQSGNEISNTNLEISEQGLHALTITSDHRNVVKLKARRNHLRDLPDEFGSLVKLEEVSFRENFFVQFPVVLCQMTNLCKLSLSFNRLTTIPSAIGNLVHLELLTLAGNSIAQLPQELDQLTNLRALDLQTNRLTSLPDAMSKLEKLELLSVQKNQISALPDLSRLKLLKHLNVSFNRLTCLPATICNLPSLDEFFCSGNRLTTLPPNFFASLKSLTNCDFHTNAFESIPAQISHGTNLKRLNFAINRLQDLPVEIQHLQRLTWLNLNDNKLVTLPSCIERLTELRKIGLVQNEISSLPTSIAKLPNLLKIDIRRNKMVLFPSSMRTIAQSAFQLNHLENPLEETIGLLQPQPSSPPNLVELALNSIACHFHQKLCGGDLQQRPLSSINFGSDESFDSIKIGDELPTPRHASTSRLSNLQSRYQSEFFTTLPSQLLEKWKNLSQCDVCLHPSVHPPLQFIDHVMLGKTHGKTPMKFLLCSSRCLSFYQRGGSVEEAQVLLMEGENGRGMVCSHGNIYVKSKTPFSFRHLAYVEKPQVSFVDQSAVESF